MLTRRDLLGQIACAFAAAGVASRIPAAAIVEPTNELALGLQQFVGSPMNACTMGQILRFVVSSTNTSDTTMNVGGLGTVGISRAAMGLRDGDVVEFRL